LEAVFAGKRLVKAKDATTQDTSHERLLERNTLEQFKRTLQEAMG
jgi:hypothetical protein